MEKGLLSPKGIGRWNGVLEKLKNVANVSAKENDCGNRDTGSTQPDIYSDLIEAEANIGTSTPISYVRIINGAPSKKHINFRTLLAPASSGFDVAISLEPVRLVTERFSNSVFGYQLGKRVVYPIVENYVMNAWSKYGLVKSMMTTNAKALGNLKVEGTSTLNYFEASSNLVDEEQKEGLPMQKEAAVTSTCEPSTTMAKQHISVPSTSMGDKGEESKDEDEEFDVYDRYEDQFLDLSDEHIYFVMLMISVSEAKIGRSASYRFYL
ncbi:hypothetical protein Tco_0805992 [Tanacetum coccineum]